MASIVYQLEALPARPGVYLFKDKEGHVLYTGKAKRLNNRVRSYFNFSQREKLSRGAPKGRSGTTPSSRLDPAKQQMVPKIANIETIICDNENEALILEANLIRQHRPPYNVLLTDDKHYLFIKITKAEYPRVFAVRKISSDGAHYFGPYSSGRSVRATLYFLRRLFPYQTDKDIPRDTIFPHPLFAQSTKSAPRRAPQSSKGATWGSPKGEVGLNQYQDNIRHIIKFLQGDRQFIIKKLEAGMKEAAKEKAYERATIFRDQLQALERLEGNQKVYLARRESFDVISLATQNTRSAANVFSIRQGKLQQKNTFLLKHQAATPTPDILRQFLLQYYRDAQDIPRLILIPEPLPELDTLPFSPHPRLHTPLRGTKKKLLSMGELNARQLLSAETIQFQEENRLKHAATELLKITGSSSALPMRIETYDISNTQGELATGSMIVFVNGRAVPAQYRKFRIKTVLGSNDYLMLQEVLRRRFKHTSEPGVWTLPNLVLIDGGKGQLNAALHILSELNLKIPVAAIAKQKEELFLPGRPDPVLLPYDSDALFLIQRMRDEAHRFTITYHRLLRSRRATRSLLDDIPGIGPKTKKVLLRRFGSVAGIRQASDEDLSAIIGSKTKILREYL